MRLNKTIITLFLVLIITLSTAYALPTQPANIRGYVIMSNGIVVGSGVPVTASNLDAGGVQVGSASTDVNGYYSLDITAENYDEGDDIKLDVNWGEFTGSLVVNNIQEGNNGFANDITITSVGVDLSPNSQSGTANPNTNKVYTITIQNTGTNTDTYILSSVIGTLNTNSVTLEDGVSTTFTLTVNIPSGTLAGTVFDSSVTAISSNNPQKTETVTLTTIANAIYGVDASPNSQSGTVDPGSSKSYTITVSNTGNTADTYTISTTGGTLNTNSLNVAYGSSQTVTLTVSAPAGTAAGTTYSYDVTVTSDNDGTKTETVSTITTVNTFADGEITSFVSAPTIKLGENPTFTVNFKNNGNYNFEATAYVDVKDKFNTLVGTLSGSATAVAAGTTGALTVNLGSLITSTGYYTLEPRAGYESKTATGTSNTLQVLSVPSLSVSPDSISLTLAGDKITTNTIYLSNEGESVLTVDTVTPWTSTDNTKVSITSIPATINGEATDQATVQIDTTGLAEGTYNVDLTINSDGGSQTIPFTIIVSNSDPAVLISNPAEIIKSTGSTTTGTVTLSNLGGIAASSITASVIGSLSSAITLGTVPTDILVDASETISYTIDSTGLAVGTYSDILRVSYDSTGAQTLDIPITLTVEGADLTITSASVTGYADGTTKSATVTITNTGTADITNIVLTPNDLGSFSASNIAVSPLTILGLNPGESVTITINVVIPSGTSVATYTGAITLDSDQVDDQIDLSVVVQSTGSGSSSSSSSGGGGGGGGGSLPKCNDKKDNDGDGLVDMADPGCSTKSDNDEKDEEAASTTASTTSTSTETTGTTSSQTTSSEEQSQENLAGNSDNGQSTEEDDSSNLITGAVTGLSDTKGTGLLTKIVIGFFVLLILVLGSAVIYKRKIKKKNPF